MPGSSCAMISHHVSSGTGVPGVRLEKEESTLVIVVGNADSSLGTCHSLHRSLLPTIVCRWAP